MNGKYIVNGAEAKSSEESLTEENQKKLWELSGSYTKMEGYEPIEVGKTSTPNVLEKKYCGNYVKL